MDNLLSSINLIALKEQLQNAPYEEALGIRIAHLEETSIGEKEVELIAVMVDPGKQLVPHLHEIDGEVCIPLTKGLLTLGDAKKNGTEYEVNEEGKIIVNWEPSQELTPGLPLNVPAGKAHHLFAPKDTTFILLFLLPKTHLSTDRKFTTYPETN